MYKFSVLHQLCVNFFAQESSLNAISASTIYGDISGVIQSIWNVIAVCFIVATFIFSCFATFFLVKYAMEFHKADDASARQEAKKKIIGWVIGLFLFILACILFNVLPSALMKFTPLKNFSFSNISVSASGGSGN